MPIAPEDLELFEIIYSKHVGKPMEFIQEQVFQAKSALLANHRKIEEAAGKKSYRALDKEDLKIRSRSEILAAIRNDSITCCICGKNFQSLGGHLKQVHKVSPKDYVRVCEYPEGTRLMSKKYLERARGFAKNAQDRMKQKTSPVAEKPKPKRQK